MEDENRKLEGSAKDLDAASLKDDKIAELNGQITELKRELEAASKKLRKAEFERDSAQRSVENLKTEARDLGKKLQEERKKTLEGRNKSNDPLQAESTTQESSIGSNKKKSWLSGGHGSKDLKESLEQAAADAMSLGGFVYDERTGLYYDWNTGYYYDPNSRLYYENTTGTYYYYDEQSATYKFHSKVDLSCNLEEAASTEIKNDEDERESGKETSDDEEKNDKDSEITEVQFPCIRAIVIKSLKMKVGSLFIVTCTGGTIGREKDMSHVIRLPDFEVSKLQCNIEFDKERRQYFICDVGSRNGTFLNGSRLSESKQKSQLQVITHGDELTLGTTTFHLHIHPGTQTCDSCEPGQVQALAHQGTSTAVDDDVTITKVVPGDRLLNSLSVQEQRKSELKRIKRAYALEDSTYCEQPTDGTLAGKYKNRAEVRRTKVGSDVPVATADDLPASVHRPIKEENVGRKMLEKMGWKEGEGLGREGAGRLEPVTVEVRDSLRGLGSGVKRSIDDVDSKSYIRAKTRERFEQPKSATSGTVKFVAADTTRPEKESSSNFNEINDISVEKPGSSQELPLTLKTEELDIFAE